MNKIISNKDGVIFTKLSKNEYTFTTDIMNTNINLKENINFINKDEGIILFLFKHFFEDIGFPQYYFHKYAKIEFLDNKNIIIDFTSNNLEKNDLITDETEEFCFDQFKIKLNFDDDNKANGLLFVEVNENMELYNFVEKIIGVILTKIILILKYIIENYHILNNE